MTPKSLTYMLAAVFVGYMLVSTVPDQVAMYATPTLSGEAVEVVTIEGHDFLDKNESDISESKSYSDSAGDAVGAVAATASRQAEDAATAAEATTTVSATSSDLGLIFWWTVDVLIALSVYMLARNRFK